MVDRIERELVLPALPQDVWDVVTGPGWLAEEVELDLVPGGDACFTSEDGSKAGWIEEVVAPGEEDDSGRLVFWWAADGQPATRVELSLDAQADGTTRLRVVEGRPLDVLDVVGILLPRAGGANHGPAMLSLA